MLAKFLFFILIFIQLNASIAVNSIYYINTNEVMLRDIVTSAQKDIQLFHIQKHKNSKKVKSKELIKLLHQHGYKEYTSKDRYINFIKKSPIDTSKIKKSIEEFYKEHYLNIKIKNIIVEPRGYLTALPKKYSTDIKLRNRLSNSGILNIKTLQNKKIFFNYEIDATIDVFVSKNYIKKGVELSPLNSKKKSIILSKFRALPLGKITNSTLQAKRTIKEDEILTMRDVITLRLVKKNSMVVVHLNDANIDITFSAKALQDGKNGDIITVVKSDKKRLKVRVIGRNRVEIR